MPTLIEQLLLDDPSQVVERGYFFENSSEGVGIITDRSDECINYEVLSRVFGKLVESSEHLKKLLNTNLSKARNINIEFSMEDLKKFRDRKDELIIDSFSYQMNFQVNFILNYFENISKIYLKICPSFKIGLFSTEHGYVSPQLMPSVLDIGVTGYLCYESDERNCHQEKLSFKPRTTISIRDLFWCYSENMLPNLLFTNNIFKHGGNYDGMFSIFKKEIAEKLAQLINVD